MRFNGGMAKQQGSGRRLTGIGAGIVAAVLSIGAIDNPVLATLGIVGAIWLGYGIATDS